MNWLQFIASLVSSLAWPIFIFVVLIVFRDPLSKVILTLTRFRYKDIEVDFGRKVEELKEEAIAANIKPEPLKNTAPIVPDSSQILQAAAVLADISARSAVVLGWSAVERELASAVKRLGISPDYPPYSPASRSIHLLHENHAIDPASFHILNRMWHMVNLVSHPSSGDISADEANNFIALAVGIVNKLRTLQRG